MASRDHSIECEWQGPMWNDCGCCNYTRRTDSRGYGLRWCLWCGRDAHERLRTLASNLAIGAGLCGSFYDGQAWARGQSGAYPGHEIDRKRVETNLRAELTRASAQMEENGE